MFGIFSGLQQSQRLLSLVLKVKSFVQMAPHSVLVTNNYKSMDIQILPALSDNFMYLVVDKATKEAAIVDPYDASLVVDKTNEIGVNLTTVLTTHHHSDHAGGNKNLVSKIKDRNITVVGGDERVEAVTKIAHHNDEFFIGKLKVKCLSTPCHTTGHICYYVTSPELETVVFTGDTLFIGGCGRFFEGTADMMYNSLIKILGSLPDETKVYCGHEYTVTNLKFAAQVEPSNEDVKKKLKWATENRANMQPTVPSTIGEEKKTNPFMRVVEKSVQSYAKTDDMISTMHYVRNEKDKFRA